jgi:cellulose synthase/poly-beta-1,6-N-acetylglucosamine synthase-like glycosyltransferase
MLEALFWIAIGLIAYAHIGYPLVLAVLTRLRRSERSESNGAAAPGALPGVSLIVAAHDEEAVIAKKVANAFALDYPRDRLQVVVASDGSTDRTVELASDAGADLVLDLPRGGKVAALNAAFAQATGELLAFSDANSFWEPSALRRLVSRFADERVGYVCGQVRFTGGDRGANQEGLYWSYEMAIRQMESELAGVTAGNGAIYAVRRAAFIEIDPSRGHDLSLPFELTKRGLLAVYEPGALATEKMAPTIEGEFARKRRMMWGVWDAMLGWGMLSPRGYSPLYAFQIVSHRLLRYATPWLHLVALGANLALLSEGPLYAATLIAQLALLAAGVAGRFVASRPLRVAYYYLAVTSSIAAGLWDRVRAGRVPIGWEKVEGTR